MRLVTNFFLVPMLSLMTILLSPFSGLAQVSIIDDAGDHITLPEPAKRIVSLYGGITEIVCAINACDNLVGVTKRDAWPSRVKDKPRIGTHMRPNLELILGLHPDLVLQGSSRPGSQLVVEKLKRMGIKVAIFNPRDFSSLFSTIKRISILLGHTKEADKLITNMEKDIERCKERYPLQKKPKVIFEVSYPSLLFAGKRNIINDIINEAGGINCIKKDKKFVRLDLEQIIIDDPDIYIVQKGPMNRNSLPPSKRPNFESIRAVRQGHVIVVNEFLFSRPGPRSVEAVEQLRRFLYSIYGTRKSEQER